MLEVRVVIEQSELCDQPIVCLRLLQQEVRKTVWCLAVVCRHNQLNLTDEVAPDLRVFEHQIYSDIP